MQTPRLPLSAMVRWLLNRNIYRLPARWLYVFRPQTPSTEPDFRGFAAGRKVDEDRVRGHGASPSCVYTLSKQSWRKKSVRRLTDDEKSLTLAFWDDDTEFQPRRIVCWNVATLPDNLQRCWISSLKKLDDWIFDWKDFGFYRETILFSLSY